jgi:hypothetical protein
LEVGFSVAIVGRRPLCSATPRVVRANENCLATNELRELRHRYKAAYTVYLTCVQALSDASQKGVWLSAEIREKEEKVFSELTFLRQALLDALYAHTHPKGNGGRSKHSK